MADAGIEGALAMSLDWDGQRVNGLRVRSTRRTTAADVLLHRSPAEAIALVGQLFSVCGKSQAVAAALAYEGAAGIEPDEAALHERRASVAAEIAHETFWRLLLDWPRAAGETPDAALLARIRARLAGWEQARRDLAGVLEQLLQGPPGVFAEREPFDDWLDGGASPVARVFARARDEVPRPSGAAVALLPPMTPARAENLARRLDRDARFAAVPDWDGSPRETGARARLVDHPLATLASPVLARFAARVVELAELLEGAESADIGSAALSPGDGIGWVETARGLLVHRMVLEGSTIARYQMVAPTEWNFHPRGAAALELAGLQTGDAAALGRRAELLVQSLDPCVAWSIEVGHA